MIFYTLLVYSCFTVYLFFGVYVYLLNKESKINRSFVAVCINLIFWALGYALMNSAKNAEGAFFWLLFSSLGWCFFHSSFLYFALMLTKKGGISEKRWFRAALYLPSIIFFLDNTRLPLNGFVRTDLGWIYHYPSNVVRDASFILYYSSFLLAALFLIFQWGRKTKSKQERNQAKVIIVSTIISLLLGSVFDIVLPILKVEVMPMAIVFLIIGISGVWYAITKYKMMTLAPEAAVNYLLKTMTDPVLFIGDDHLIEDVNQAFLNITGYAKEELIGRQIETLLAEPTEPQESRGILQEGVQNLEISITAKDMRQIPFLASSSVLTNNLGEPLGTVCLLHDITARKKEEIILKEAHALLEEKVRERTAELENINMLLRKEINERKQAQDKIRFIAYHDPLTGLPNRLLLDDRLNQAIYQAQRNEQGLAVIFLDLDNFKLVNDSLGHAKGDILLQQVAQRLKAISRKSDTVARISGDEFVMVITNLKRNEDLFRVINKIKGEFERPFKLGEHECFTTASMGIAVYPCDGEDNETLTRNADLAMYEAKKAGRNTYILCSTEMKLRFREKMMLRNSLYRALERKELSVYYQPQIDILRDRIVGFEALMRWELDGERFIPPAEFIPIAEETDLIIPLGEWLITTACRTLKKLHVEGFSDLKMAVNISEKQLKQPDFSRKVLKILEETGVSSAFLEIEVTERIVFEGNEEIILVLDELKEKGVTISIDDFGKDYSSFMNVKRLPIDKIKIDMDYTRGINVNAKDAAIVDAIILLCHKVGLKVLAEGVETAEQLEYFKKMLCDQVQGFYFYQPLPQNEIDRILQHRILVN